MGEELRFDGRVVLVTGAGAGLGRSYALLFAERGASVVVNDLGGGRHGDGKSSKAADEVVHEIVAKGGIAVADTNSVVDGKKIIKNVIEKFGRIDVVVNNAGILRDKSFVRINKSDWEMIQDIHLNAAFKITQAAWPFFRKQNYGRIIMTSSNSGLYGNFGQANYSAAKMGLIGLCNTLAIEGKKYNIHCNVIVPTAGSRLTEDILPPEFFAELKPDLIAPVTVWLSHEQCEDNGAIIETAAGWATKYSLMRGPGSLLRYNINDSVTLENVKHNWNKVTDMTNPVHLNSIEEASATLMDILEQLKTGQSKGASSSLGKVDMEYSLNEKSCILYALGIGATVSVSSDLKYLYENHQDFSAFPTLAIIPGQITMMSSSMISTAIPGKDFDLSQVLHGEQYLEVYKPISTTGRLRNECTIADVLDKGKNAIILCNVNSFNEVGEKVAFCQFTVIVVGGGGFGGKRSSNKSFPAEDPPSCPPDNIVSQKTSLDQAALYRLTGDINPLHIDPNFALIGGFQKPILHGLCSLGFSARHVLMKYGNNDPASFKAIKARFVKPVVPGDTLMTEMWPKENRIYFRTSSVDSGNVVVSGAFVDLHKVQGPVVLNQVAGLDLKSDAVFSAIEDKLKADKDIVKKINGVFVYIITSGGKPVATWTLDLKNGKVLRGNPEKGIKIDTTLTVDDQDMMDIAIGKLSPQAAFMKGKLKIKGNLMLTQKLKDLMGTKSQL